ncbi:MAG: hypothetical protein M0C28_18360 [Candidatus Moduliflexus flocculans]|nr:hypothetical protein [Candidatus Moduliflexus flocculans]
MSAETLLKRYLRSGHLPVLRQAHFDLPLHHRRGDAGGPRRCDVRRQPRRRQLLPRRLDPAVFLPGRMEKVDRRTRRRDDPGAGSRRGSSVCEGGNPAGVRIWTTAGRSYAADDIVYSGSGAGTFTAD